MGMVLKFFETLTGSSGAANAITNVAKLSMVMGAATAVFQWLQGHGNEVAVAFNYNQMFYGMLVILAIVCVAHRANFPRKENDGN